jgi:hypothetical protein
MPDLGKRPHRLGPGAIDAIPIVLDVNPVARADLFGQIFRTPSLCSRVKRRPRLRSVLVVFPADAARLLEYAAP